MGEFVRSLPPPELAALLVGKGHGDVIAGADANMVNLLTYHAEMRKRLVDATGMALLWKARGETAEKGAKEAELKLKAKEAEHAQEKLAFSTAAEKYNLERKRLEALAQERAVEMETLKARLQEEKEARLQAQNQLTAAEEKNKLLEGKVEQLQAEVRWCKEEKEKVVMGFPGLVQKLVDAPEFCEPLAVPYNACIRFGHHQACCRVLEADPDFDRAKFGDYFDEDALKNLEAAAENMFPKDYPFLSLISSLAHESAETILAAQPKSKKAGDLVSEPADVSLTAEPEKMDAGEGSSGTAEASHTVVSEGIGEEAVIP